MKLHFLGAAHEVTGSCTLLTTAHHRILVDCGMEQGADMYENPTLPISPADVDAVLLTHAHNDHAGRLPLLVKQGFSGPIYTTAATAELCKITLMDAAQIQASEVEWRNRKGQRQLADPDVPMYTPDDVTRTLSLMHPCGYNADYPLFEDVSLRFTDAGHLMGSASISITVTENNKKETVLFSGDVGNVRRPLIRDPQTPPAADYVILESTYGDRLHGDRPDYIGQMTRILQETFDRGGNVVIPCGAIGQTQNILYLLRHIEQNNLLRGHENFPVWVDNPLAAEVTNLYASDLTAYFDEETLAVLATGNHPIRLPNLHLAITTEESRAINLDPTPKVILSSASMCEAGRIRHHLKHNLWRHQSTILFVGYQAANTIGGQLIAGEPEVELFNETIRVAAHIENLNGVSGHADRALLLKWLSDLSRKPRRVYVNHGDNKACEALAAAIDEELGIPSTAPYNDAVYDLTADVCLQAGNTTRKNRQQPVDAADAAFHRLKTMGRRLMELIEKYRGATPNDIQRFASQIQSLTDKWAR